MNAIFQPGDLVRARGREWINLPSTNSDWLSLRPLSGGDGETIVLDPTLEADPVTTARFDLPADAALTTQSSAALLADALRLSLRRGAGPFRSAAQLAFEPRIYQLVPLLMALRMPVPRLLIADDVGIGKTIEAGLILREALDRGEADAFSVLCPPHLVDQWLVELRTRFGIEATAVTSSSASRLERGIPLSQTLFDAYPFTVVSLDYIKADKRRDAFARSCPKFVIVDEAHACVGTKSSSKKTRQQRFDLLKHLAKDEERAMLLLTATPHSGDEEAFARLLSLVDESFAEVKFDNSAYRMRLARHLIQRRRIDITSQAWGEDRAFPKHDTSEASYPLTPAHRRFHECVLDYCMQVVLKAGDDQRKRRLAYWGTLALMGCVGSSPAAALSALKNRATAEDARLEALIFDEVEDEDAVDIEPPVSLTTETETASDSELAALINQAEALVKADDPKINALVTILKKQTSGGSNPVVFCRFIATANYVAAALRKAFPKHTIEAVTGLITSDERRARVEQMDGEGPRILVATDCLSEGVNLQQLFDGVVHYDLAWNPTRHQQREGRVDRFGQPSKLVWSSLMFSPDSIIDAAVLDVILRKARAIKEATGVSLSLPEDRSLLTDALMSAVLRLRGGSSKQYAFDLRLDDGATAMTIKWRDAEENEKKSRARFAQNAMKPHEVAPEWKRAQSLLGDTAEAQRFVRTAMAKFGIPIEDKRRHSEAYVSYLPKSIRDRLDDHNIINVAKLAMSEPAPLGTAVLNRSHPLTATLAEALFEGALEPDSMPDLELGRVGAWPTAGVQERTVVALMRMRFKMTTHGRREQLLLAEEASLVAIRNGKIVATDDEVRTMIRMPATHDLAEGARRRMTVVALAELNGLMDGVIATYAMDRSNALADDHARVRIATANLAGAPSRVSVTPAFPPDVIGLFVLLPAEA